MRVMCIKDGPWIGSISKRIEDGPKYGEICTVIEERMGHIGRVYILQEYPDPGGYTARRFIPLSEVDEIELVETLETVNHE